MFEVQITPQRAITVIGRHFSRIFRHCLQSHTTPGYPDKFPQPAALTKWQDKGIYRVGDRQ